MSDRVEDFSAAKRSLAMLNDLATKYGVANYKGQERCLEGELLIRRGEFAAGSIALRAALNGYDWESQKAKFLVPWRSSGRIGCC